jgi:hypothetical protein
MRTLSALVLLLLATPALSQERTLSFDHPLQDGGTLVVDTYKGSVDVEAWDRDEVRIDVRITADDDADAVELVDIRFDGSRGRVAVETDYERVRDSNSRRFLGIVVSNNVSLPFVHYTIRMPRGAHLTVDDYKSEIRLAGLESDVTVESYKGSIVVDGARDLVLDTYKGTARARALTGAARVETYKGDVELAFAQLGGDVAVDTYRGSVRLVVPYGAGFRLDADLGRRGTLDTALPMQARDGYARGTMGKGGPTLAFETYRGTLHLDAIR